MKKTLLIAKTALCLLAMGVTTNLMAAETITLTDNVFYGQLKQGTDYTISGVTTTSDWYYDADFFTVNGDGTLKFMAVNGDYTIKADTDRKYYRVFAGQEVKSGSTTASTAKLQADGTGAIWVIGSNVNKPTYKAVPEAWNTDPGHALCMAQVKPKVYQITFTVGQQLKSTDVDFKFFFQTGWDNEFNPSKTNKISTTSDVFVVANDGNIHLASGATLNDGDVCKFTIDCNSGITNVVLQVDVERKGVAKDIIFNGQKMVGFEYNGTLTQNANISVTGQDISDWYIDPDFFEVVNATTLKFKAVTGSYCVKADVDNKYFRVWATEGGNPATLQSDGTGAMWVIGNNGCNKPTYTSNPNSWWTGVNNDLCMAQVQPKVYQLTLTVGEQLNGDAVDFKFFGQPDWGLEFKTNISTTSDVFAITSSGNVNLAKGQKLTAGDTYVFTIDCTQGISAVVLQVAKKNDSAGIAAMSVDGQKSKAVYSLSGQRVVNPSKGLYIIDGKKVVLK